MSEAALADGRAALARCAWADGFALLTEAGLDDRLTAEDLEALGEAAFWTSRPRDCVRFRERSFAAYGQTGNAAAASRVALALVWDYFALRRFAVGGGWMAKAQRLLTNLPECREHGRLADAVAHIDIAQGKLDAALAGARDAFAIGERLNDADLQAAALNTQGSVLIRLGQVAEGMRCIDESMASAVAGGLEPFTTAAIYCTTISACQRIGDLRRATEWTDAAEHCADRPGMQDFPGDCRAHRVSLLRVTGAWDDAEAAAERALAVEGAEPSHLATVHQEVGEMRILRGRLDAAEAAFRAAEALGRTPQPGRALLSLARGDAEAAVTLIAAAVDEQTWDRLARARLLPAQVEIALAANAPEVARGAAAELADIAGVYETVALTAAARHAQGRIAAADGDLEGAVGPLRDAMRLWLELPAPHDAARSRLALAETLAGLGRLPEAEVEARAAGDAFERLGAAPDAVRAERALAAFADARSARNDVAVRVNRTFMFTDIVGSTSLLEVMGDEAWRSLVRWHDEALRQRFAEHGGEEIDHAGDGFFVSFETADAALDCAVSIQTALARHRREHGFAPPVRIGVHAADATRDREGYSGIGVHHAARIATLAGGNEILVSAATLEAAATPRAASAPREVALKGIAEPASVVALDY